MTDLEPLARAIERATGQPFKLRRHLNVGGGCINRAVVLSSADSSYFVKLNSAERLSMFEAEAAGLEALGQAAAIRVPTPICCGTTDAQAYLVMTHCDLSGRLDPARAGEGLAQLHRNTATGYGWHRDNTIGSTPQHNHWAPDWVSFWRDHRLGFQLERAVQNGHGRDLGAAGERLLLGLSALIGHHPPASLLHGDLWGGNIGALPDGEPVLFDPAVYYGDRETDLAMTELFGGFGSGFHAAYRAAWPLPPEFATRKVLYNLYHVLNHLNLFGGGYRAQAQRMIDQLLAEIR
ncbi:hypothetical protein CKO25_00220 [Thiocapsa imhoffii]|uniref:Fructosamine kinase family protein n=1 Tax=Thiocapsa imhoffii TaxID=382777 RepID=A0A9X0WEZ7_9GAMM|nr:fructosamine kinase family protein [Thiocapsa imhoffii]MBK1643104.1 hypothetical protein [Thiocapsa imhoffii]